MSRTFEIASMSIIFLTGLVSVPLYYFSIKENYFSLLAAPLNELASFVLLCGATSCAFMAILLFIVDVIKKRNKNLISGYVTHNKMAPSGLFFY